MTNLKPFHFLASPTVQFIKDENAQTVPNWGLLAGIWGLPAAWKQDQPVSAAILVSEVSVW